MYIKFSLLHTWLCAAFTCRTFLLLSLQSGLADLIHQTADSSVGLFRTLLMSRRGFPSDVCCSVDFKTL